MARKPQTDKPAEAPSPPAEQQKKPPAHEVRIGRLRATVWRNTDAQRGDWFSITLTRSYKDAQDKWHTAHTYGRDDCLVAAEIFRLCWLWISSQAGAKGVGDIPVPGGADSPGEEEVPI